jgi:type VI secretion system secreted protein VgrG
VQRNQSSGVGANRTLQVTQDLAMSVGKNVVINAGDSLTLKVGPASLTMRKDGSIVIKGTDITIEGSGKINVKARRGVVLKGRKIVDN